MIPKSIVIGKDRQEIVQPAMINFPLKFIVQEFSPHTYQFIDWHWHDAVQYCFVNNGTITFQIGQYRESVPQGDGLFINSQQVHTAFPQSPGSTYFCLNLPCSLIGPEGTTMFHRFAAPLLFQSRFAFLPFHQTDPDAAAVLTCLKRCCKRSLKGKELFDLELLADLILLWNHTLNFLPKNTAEKPALGKTNERIQGILTYISKNYAQQITLEQIAAAIHVSRNECSRIFHSVTGQPLFSYLTAFRIAKSINLLLKTEKSISEIAYETGFCNQSYYTQRFKLKEGLSPNQFRKKFK